MEIETSVFLKEMATISKANEEKPKHRFAPKRNASSCNTYKAKRELLKAEKQLAEVGL